MNFSAKINFFMGENRSRLTLFVAKYIEEGHSFLKERNHKNKLQIAPITYYKVLYTTEVTWVFLDYSSKQVNYFDTKWKVSFLTLFYTFH